MGGTFKRNVTLALTVVIAYATAVTSDSTCDNAACPPYNGSSIIVPNPNECESFCVCTCDGAIYMPCPAGLHYNKECHMCDWPSHAGCDPNFPSDHTTVKPPPVDSCDKVTPLCPPTNEGNATLLPNPDDCGSYCVCDWGNAIWMPCPAGLHFNPVLKVCDYPDHAGCKPGPKPTPTPNPGTTAKPTPTGSCDKVKPLCPPTNEGNATLLPNPDDCGSYCVCNWGNAIWMPCPAGLHFNPVLKVCDYPDHAGCKPGPKPTPTPKPTTVRPPPPPGPCDKYKPLCPPVNDVNATLLPNPDDCGSYCVCDWGNIYWMPCPPGLHFNPILKVCDYPDHAGCGVVPTDPPKTSQSTAAPTTKRTTAATTTEATKPTTTQAPTTVTTKATTTSTQAPTTVTTKATTTSTAATKPAPTTAHPPSTSHGIDGCFLVEPKCPVPENPDHVTLFANPWDVRSYCECDRGKAHWMPCGPGTIFYEERQACI